MPMGELSSVVAGVSNDELFPYYVLLGYVTGAEANILSAIRLTSCLDRV